MFCRVFTFHSFYYFLQNINGQLIQFIISNCMLFDAREKILYLRLKIWGKVHMKLGYGRVLAKDQNLERQLVKFRELGVDERYIFVDKQSGKDFERPRYQAIRLMLERAT